MHKLEVISKHLRELASPDGEIIFENKSDKPVVVLLKSPVSAYTSIVLLPPAGCYLAAAGVCSPTAHSVLHDYTGKMVHDESVYKDFLKWMRREKIKKDFVPTILFNPYTRWGGSISSVGKKFDDTPYFQKIERVFVGDEHVGSIIAFFEAQLPQFQEYSFVSDDMQCKNRTCKYVLHNLDRSIEPDVYGDRSIIYDINKWIGENGERLLRSLEHVVERLEQGERLFPNITFPESVLIAPRIPWASKFSNLEVKRKCVVLRSKIIALLGFPWFYTSIVYNVQGMRECADLVIREIGHDAYIEVLSNLDSFVQKIRTKYPIVDANPLAMPVAN